MTLSCQDHPDGCPSQLALDRFFAGECNDLEKARLLRHVASCADCAEALTALPAEREAFAPDPVLLARLEALRIEPTTALVHHRALAPKGRPRRWSRSAPVVLALASCAALLALTLRPRGAEQLIERRAASKGDSAVSLFVRRAGELVPIGESTQLHPADQLQVVLRVATPRYAALYSRDGAGTISRYAPITPTMARVLAGDEVPLPNSTVLDEVLGPETLTVFLCAHPQDEALLRAHVEAGEPAGCEVRRLRLDKVAP